MDALKGETLIKELNNKKIKLTNFRVRFYTNGSAYTSIMLDKISIINVTYHENIKYLHYAIISLVGVFIAFKLNFPFEIPLGLALLFYIAYVFHKEKVIYINSVGNKAVQFSVSGLSTNNIDEFIDEVEKQSFKLKGMIE